MTLGNTTHHELQAVSEKSENWTSGREALLTIQSSTRHTKLVVKVDLPNSDVLLSEEASLLS